MTERFTGQCIAITGAAGGLGREVAKLFAGDGAGLVLMDRDTGPLNGEISGTDLVDVDLLDADATAKAVEQAFERTGGIDAVCCLAGGFHMGEPVHDIPAGKWQLMDDLNVQTLLNTLRPLVPMMMARGGGKIVTVGANAALKGMPNMAAYCASKSVVMRITESMAGELRGQGINVNCFLPSIIDTPANRAAMPDADPGLWVSPAQLYGVLSFLCSGASTGIHGALIPVVGLS